MNTERWDLEKKFMIALLDCIELEAEAKALTPEKDQPLAWDVIDNARGIRSADIWRIPYDRLVWLIDSLQVAGESMAREIARRSAKRA